MEEKGLLPKSEVIHNMGNYEDGVTWIAAVQGPVDKDVACAFVILYSHAVHFRLLSL